MVRIAPNSPSSLSRGGTSHRIQKRFSLGSRCCTTSSTGYSSSFCQRSRAHAALRTRWAPSSRRRGREEGYRTAKVMISLSLGFVRTGGWVSWPPALRGSARAPRLSMIRSRNSLSASPKPVLNVDAKRLTSSGSSTCLRNSRAQSTASRGAISRRQRTQKAMPSGAFLRKSSKMSVPCVRNRLSMSSPSGKRTTLQDSPRVNSISHARSAALRPGPSPSKSRLPSCTRPFTAT